MKKVSVSIFSALFLCIGWASVTLTAAAQENPNFIKRTVNRYSPLPSINE